MELGTSHVVTVENNRPLDEATATISEQLGGSRSCVPTSPWTAQGPSPRRGQVSPLSVWQPPSGGRTAEFSTPALGQAFWTQPWGPWAGFLIFGPFPSTPASGSFSLLSQKTLYSGAQLLSWKPAGGSRKPSETLKEDRPQVRK